MMKICRWCHRREPPSGDVFCIECRTAYGSWLDAVVEFLAEREGGKSSSCIEYRGKPGVGTAESKDSSVQARTKLSVENSESLPRPYGLTTRMHMLRALQAPMFEQPGDGLPASSSRQAS